MSKTRTQLDAEIAEALHGHLQQQRSSSLQPIKDLWIPVDSRSALIKFWRSHPALRNACLIKYGFDPIDDEKDYWRFGLTEPDHRDVLRAVRQNSNIFSYALVKRWEAEELAHSQSRSRGRSHRSQEHATRKRLPEAVRVAIEEHALNIIQGAYQHYAAVGGKEPCLTVGLITDYLRQAHMPEDFRWALKEQQRTWTRSVLESMRRRNKITSSFGARARCYEPKR